MGKSSGTTRHAPAIEDMVEGLLYLVSSFWLGAVHAATPGHGKTIAASYIVGARGRPVDALVLGIFVTLSHTSGIVLVAALATLGSAWLQAWSRCSQEHLGWHAGREARTRRLIAGASCVGRTTLSETARPLVRCQLVEGVVDQRTAAPSGYTRGRTEVPATTSR
jgi:High-affinity nickel-transport protein